MSQVEDMMINWGRVYKSYALAYATLLGSKEWSIMDDLSVTNGSTVTIHTRRNEISYLDLAPGGEDRQTRVIKLPGECSIGTTVAIAQAVASLG